jgi:phospholipid-binding lipoprotein MlaA
MTPEPQRLSPAAEARTSAQTLEQLNRSTFESNQHFNHAVIYPIANAYRDTVPEPVRDSIDAFSNNLNEPVVFANNVLQLRFAAAATTLGRFGLNSTVGIGGLFDVAAKQGLARQTGDFGQTLYVWGFRDSDPIVLPVLGPTNVRDAFGNGVELGAQVLLGTVLPTSAVATANHVGTVGTVTSPVASLNKVEQLQELERTSIDFYSMLRSVVEQKRQGELRDALKESLVSTLPGLEDHSDTQPGSPVLSPALSSPALQAPTTDLPPAIIVPPGPAEGGTQPEAEPEVPAGWTVVLERRRAG